MKDFLIFIFVSVASIFGAHKQTAPTPPAPPVEQVQEASTSILNIESPNLTNTLKPTQPVSSHKAAVSNPSKINSAQNPNMIPITSSDNAIKNALISINNEAQSYYVSNSNSFGRFCLDNPKFKAIKDSFSPRVNFSCITVGGTYIAISAPSSDGGWWCINSGVNVSISKQKIHKC